MTMHVIEMIMACYSYDYAVIMLCYRDDYAMLLGCFWHAIWMILACYLNDTGECWPVLPCPEWLFRPHPRH